MTWRKDAREIIYEGGCGIILYTIDPAVGPKRIMIARTWHAGVFRGMLVLGTCRGPCRADARRGYAHSCVSRDVKGGMFGSHTLFAKSSATAPISSSVVDQLAKHSRR